MPRHHPARARLVVTVALISLALVSSSCLGLRRKGAVEPSPTRSGAYGDSLDLEDDALDIEEIPTDASGRAGTLLVQLIDTDNSPLPGAVLRYRGPKKGTAVTNRKGIATFKLAPGSYTVDVVKCGRTIVVDDTAEATAVVVSGKTKQGRLQVDADLVTPRYQPTNSAKVSQQAPWPVNRRVTVGIRFDDTCTHEQASRVAVGDYRWRATGALAIKSTASKIDAKGFANAEVVCSRAGDATLEIVHPSYPDERVDVLTSLPHAAFGNWCE